MMEQMWILWKTNVEFIERIRKSISVLVLAAVVPVVGWRYPAKLKHVCGTSTKRIGFV